MASTINATTSSGIVATADNTGTLQLQSAGTTAATFNTFGIGLGSATPSSGIGITFPAAQSASSDANTLDDYEEGTWTGSLTAVNATGLSLTNARYTKVGRLVTLTATVACTVTSSNVLTYVVIGSYPFAFVDATCGSALLNNNTKVGISQIAGGAVYAFFPAASAPTSGSESVQINISYFAS
jgi:hypothetical protein